MDINTGAQQDTALILLLDLMKRGVCLCGVDMLSAPLDML
jgi:hypothetical protein